MERVFLAAKTIAIFLNTWLSHMGTRMFHLNSFSLIICCGKGFLPAKTMASLFFKKVGESDAVNFTYILWENCIKRGV